MSNNVQCAPKRLKNLQFCFIIFKKLQSMRSQRVAHNLATEQQFKN